MHNTYYFFYYAYRWQQQVTGSHSCSSAFVLDGFLLQPTEFILAQNQKAIAEMHSPFVNVMIW
jgi:hypothetical protein